MSETGFEQNNVHIESMTIERNGTSVDIRHVFTEMVFYEDIFANAMSGYVKLLDSHNLPETLPIIGDGSEKIVVTISTNSKAKFKKEFLIYKCEDYALNGTKQYVTYKLFFASAPFILNQQKRLRRSFGSEEQGVRASEIVENVCKNMLDIAASKLYVEKSRFDRNVVCPNWTPFQLINHLAQSDILDGGSPTKDKDSTFLFYEDKDGFKFVALSTIIEDALHKNKAINSLTMTDFSKFSDKEKSIRRSDPRQILSLVLPTCFDQLANASAGLYGNRYIYHDIINKNIRIEEFDYEASFAKFATVDTGSLTGLRSNSPKEATVILPGEYHYENDSKADTPWRQVHRSRIQQLDNYIVYAEVTGNTSHVLANVVNLDIPSTMKENSGKPRMNSHLSGKFLVSKIKHVITAESYTQVLELRKGSLKKV